MFADFDLLLLQEPGLNLGQHPIQHSAWVAVHTQSQTGRINAITYINKRIYGQSQLKMVGELTTENVVTIQIGQLYITNIYNRISEDIHPVEYYKTLLPQIPELIIIAGDFNLHHPMWQSTEHVTREANSWADWVNDNGLLLATVPNVPTHIFGNTIDLTFTTPNITITPEKSEDVGSDHYLQKWRIDTNPLAIELLQTYGGRYNYKRADWENFEKVLNSRAAMVTIPKELRGYSNGKSTHKVADRYASKLIGLLCNCLDETVPKLKIVPRSKRWWTPELRQAKRDVGRARRRARSKPTEENIRLRQQANEEYASKILEAKNTTWNSFLASRRGGEIYDAHKMIKPREQESVMPALRLETGELAQTFEEQEDELYRGLFPHVTPSTRRVLKVVKTGQWKSLRTQEIEDAIRDQAPHKAPGPDGVKTVAIKRAWVVKRFRKLLKGLLKYCIRVGYHPKCFREGITVVIPKRKRDPTLARSYRPITLLSTLGKVLEKIMQRRLTALTSGMLPVDQYGGRHGSSAVEAAHKLVHHAEKRMKRGQVTSVLAIDIKGAFDHVHRDTLLDTMGGMGLPTAVQNWVYQFMRGRRTSLVIDGKRTKERRIATGIPQGSPISPLLFLIYTSPLYPLIKSMGGKVIGFIDDITIYVSSTRYAENTAKLSNILARCHEWATSAHAFIDYGEKLGFMHIAKRVTPKGCRRLILPTGERIQATGSLRLLGVTIDRQLKFDEHAKSVISKGQSALNIIRRLGGVTRGVTGATMRCLYKSCVRPILEYASPIWYNRIGKGLKEAIQRIQNAALRSILGAYKPTAIDSLHRDAEIPPVEHRMLETEQYYLVRLHRDLHRYNPHRIRARKLYSGTILGDRLDELYRTVEATDIKKDRYRLWKPPWASRDSEAISKASSQKKSIRKEIRSQCYQKWEIEYTQSPKGAFYRSFTAPRLYSTKHANALRPFLYESPRGELSKLVQLRTGMGAMGSFFQRFRISNRRYDCRCGVEETVEHILRDCPLTEEHRQILREASRELDLPSLLDTRKGLKAVASFLKANPSLLS
ncbi:polyprotein of L1-like non-LTR retrotransposon Zorro 3 [Sugiyamaella lignohabitans]|uniref:Polyprotein of L1-like non-LTR retrotransposon Zorro 3 n=1 Tax=Sugiyamaella lignohabitans TaxID=796027 RepID=A0A167EY19_9ASCO|nr:polyprotein of L1-like non-LTR retrotransposon Zorro 3 [Sugiyamaella lignohabitans]ANB14594.1 polyprotein of L1-like non-LTR retrotransposon Zorro 3 [Sugiyamaella lignohabitans]